MCAPGEKSWFSMSFRAARLRRSRPRRETSRFFRNFEGLRSRKLTSFQKFIIDYTPAARKTQDKIGSERKKQERLELSGRSCFCVYHYFIGFIGVQ